jgi:hypothetical protein
MLIGAAFQEEMFMISNGIFGGKVFSFTALIHSYGRVSCSRGTRSNDETGGIYG